MFLNDSWFHAKRDVCFFGNFRKGEEITETQTTDESKMMVHTREREREKDIVV